MFSSTNRSSPVVSLRDAVLSGLAPDGGLYLPTALPVLPADFSSALQGQPFPAVALTVARTLLHGDIPDEVLSRIVDEAFDFDTPLHRLDEDTHVLELFHGPTFAFKDFGARFMARLMSHFAQDLDHELTILTATSGDTGSAVAHGFRDVPGIRVSILYPNGGVSPIQEQMLTIAGSNITAIAVEGTFDDCQRLVKQAFVDPELSRELRLSSANSINIARLIPQTFYYAYAVTRLPPEHAPVTIAVPSGNFGNITAGLMAKRMGLPVARFIAACNAKDVVVEYLRTGMFTPRPSARTISNAMDVGNPSNFARMLEICGHRVEAMWRDLWGTRCSDDETRRAMRAVYDRYGYVLDPHGAVGYVGLERYRQEHPEPMIDILLGTAHPAKFPEVVREALGITVDVPNRMREYTEGAHRSITLANDFSTLKQFLLSWR